MSTNSRQKVITAVKLDTETLFPISKLIQLNMKNNVVANFFSDVREEIKKISWPTSKQTINTTLLVVAATIIVGIYVGLIDYLLTFLLEKFLIK